MPYETRYNQDPPPDPLDGLSAYERMKLLTMRPSWSERLRLCKPELTKEEKRDLVVDILFERRKAYDEWFHARTQIVAMQRAENRYATGELGQTNFNSHTTAMNSAYRQYVHHRREDDLINRKSKAEYERRRANRSHEDDNHRKRSRSR